MTNAWRASEVDGSVSGRGGAGQVIGGTIGLNRFGAIDQAATTTLVENPESVKLPAYPAFDWLRFVLASIVVLGHEGFLLTGPLNGGFAVDVFLALSGWLIGGILLRTDRSELPRFYFNRATRIWIPYALAIVLLYGVALLREGASFFWLKYLILDLTFTHSPYVQFPRALYEMPLAGSGNQFWSISVEEQFYLFAPLVISLTAFGRSVYFWVALSLLTMAFQVLAAPIALGVTAAILHRNHGWTISRSGWWVLLGIAAALFGALYTFPDPSIRTLPDQAIRTVLAAIIVVLVSREGVRNDVAMFFGGLSFPLYLNHWIGSFAINFVTKRWLDLPEAATITFSYLISVGLAAVLYILVDRQVQIRRNGWYSPALGRGLAVTAYTLLAIGLVVGWAMNAYGSIGSAPAQLPGINAASAHGSGT